MIIKLENLQENPNYQKDEILPNNLGVYTMSFVYYPNKDYWTMDLIYKDVNGNVKFECYGVALKFSKNVLSFVRKDKLPFWIAVSSFNGCDPFSLKAFTSGLFNIYLVNDK